MPLIIALLAALLLAPLAASAQVIHACVKNNGVVRISDSATCRRGETPFRGTSRGRRASLEQTGSPERTERPGPTGSRGRPGLPLPCCMSSTHSETI